MVVLGRMLGAVVVGLGVLSFLGRALKNETLTRLVVSPATHKVNAALCLILLGAALAP